MIREFGNHDGFGLVDLLAFFCSDGGSRDVLLVNTQASLEICGKRLTSLVPGRFKCSCKRLLPVRKEQKRYGSVSLLLENGRADKFEGSKGLDGSNRMTVMA